MHAVLCARSHRYKEMHVLFARSHRYKEMHVLFARSHKYKEMHVLFARSHKYKEMHVLCARSLDNGAIFKIFSDQVSSVLIHYVYHVSVLIS
jgi:hypothetical protein